MGTWAVWVGWDSPPFGWGYWVMPGNVQMYKYALKKHTVLPEHRDIITSDPGCYGNNLMTLNRYWQKYQ